LHGRAIASSDRSSRDRSTGPRSAHAPHAATYDGWIVSYAYDGEIVSGSSLSTQWVVPLPPANVGDQDIAFFNDIETTAGGEDILQPVLDFSEIPGHWAIESEHCCISGNDEQSTLVQVSPGDVILGVVMATSCDATGVCESWTVTTTDLTTGGSTVLNTTSPMGVPNSVNPAALETYGVTSCDMFPASGEETFIDNGLNELDGGVETLRYGLVELSGSPASLPACGYGGSTSGNSYTLTFGTSRTETGPGTSMGGGGASDASVGGARTFDTLDASSGGALDSSTDSSGSGSEDASKGDSGRPDEGGVEALPTGDSGNPSAAGDGTLSDSSDAAGSEPAGSAGCGCTLAATHPGFAFGPFGLLLWIGAWRRRARTRRRPYSAAANAFPNSMGIGRSRGSFTVDARNSVAIAAGNGRRRSLSEKGSSRMCAMMRSRGLSISSKNARPVVTL
jgi:hypothetical protein